MSNYMVVDTCQVSGPLYINSKGRNIKNFKEDTENYSTIIGGLGVMLHVIETTNCRGRIITTPNSSDDELAKRLGWLV